MDSLKEVLDNHEDVSTISPEVHPSTACERYQKLVDEVFGQGVVNIKEEPANSITGTLQHVGEYKEFKANLASRLHRLKALFEKTASYPALLTQVAEVASARNWAGAYAELVAYDIMWNDGLMGGIELNKSMPQTASYAGEMGYQETNEDGFIPELGIYFDVKILGSPVDSILSGITEEALKKFAQVQPCHILCEYPLDDDVGKYQGATRPKLLQELLAYLHQCNTLAARQSILRSQVIPDLAYKILWGGGVNSAMSAYSPYRHAEETRHLVFQRYTKKLMKEDPFFLVLVNFPWYNGRVDSFIDADQIYYRSLARRTFCEYKNLDVPMRAVVPRYHGPETVYEVSRHLTGIVFLNDNSITGDNYDCFAYMNPNAVNIPSPLARKYVISLVNHGVERSLFDDMAYDNY